MPAPSRDDPYRNFNFRVEIENVVAAAFAEVGGVASETTVIEYRTGGDFRTRKLPGRTRFPNIVLRNGVTRDRTLWDWRQTVVEGRVDRRNGAVILLDDAFEEVVRWNFFAAWPCKWEGPDLDARGDDVAIETLELAHEGIERA